MSKIQFQNKIQLNSKPEVSEQNKLTAENVNEIKESVNALYEEKAPLEDNKVPAENLPEVYFDGLVGSGTALNPYKFNGNPEEYLKSLPGYEEGVERILYGGGASGFSWGPVPTGGTQEQLATPALVAGSPTVNSIPLSWNEITDATGYVVQRSTQANFAGAVVVFSGNATSFSEYTLQANTTYYYRVRATAAGYAASGWDDVSAATVASGNIVPPAPTNAVVDDVNNTFNFTYAVGYADSIAEYEFTLDGGSTYNTASQKPIQVGNVNKAIGQVGVRVKAAAGRDSSATLFNQSAYTQSAGPDLGSSVTSFKYLNGMQSDGNGTITRVNQPDSAGAPLVFELGGSQVGFASMRFPTSFTLPGEGSTAVLSMGVGTDPHYGDADATIAVWAQTGGGLVYRVKGAAAVYTTNGIVSGNGIIRIRVNLTTAFLEISNNSGTTWTEITNTSRPSGTLGFKLNASGNQYKAVDLRSKSE